MWWRVPALLVLLAVPVATFMQPSTLASPVTMEARELTVLVGAGQDTVSAEGYFPEAVRVHAGDTITWKINSDAEHTVSFLGDRTPTILAGASSEPYGGSGIVTSGPLTRDPIDPRAIPSDAFTVRFDTTGVYTYVCLLHGTMQGTVEVVPPSATDVPDQTQIDARARTEIDEVLALVDAARGLDTAPRQGPGPNDTTRWSVRAGNSPQADARVHLAEFFPPNLVITAGDTVTWETHDMHTVTFAPVAPPPAWLTPVLQSNGSVTLVQNPQLIAPAKPSWAYDPRQYFNSGRMGGTQDEESWELTFDQPGTYDYVCGIHRELGMVGTIVVLPR